MLTFILGLVILFVGAALYGKFCEKVFGPDDRKTPAYTKEDGVDYVPMKGWKNGLINLLNIAGTGPIFGPIQGILFGPIAFTSDWEQVKKDFTGHKNIIVTPVGDEPPEKYHVTYFVNGIYLLEDGRIETLARHEVEITLHAEYPRYKPICKILTPIWHPNFRDGQICIGDIWGAGESLSDIIINIGDMIQYKSWNSYSPLSADAAQWAMDNKHLFPVGKGKQVKISN